MLKRLAAVAIATAIAAGSLFADAKVGGIARQIAMGGGPANVNGSLVLNPFLFSDPAYVLVNPAYEAQYHDYVWSNIGGGAQNGASADGYLRQNAGVNFGLAKEFSLGLILSYDPSVINNPQYRQGLNQFINGTGHRAPNPNNLAPVDIFEAVGCFSAGGLDFGFGIMYGWTDNDAKGGNGAEQEISAHTLGFRAGIDIDMGGGSRFEASGALRLDKMTDMATAGGATGTSEFGLAATEIALNARLRLKISNRVAFVPYGAFQTISGEPKEDKVPTGVTATTLSVKNTITGIAIGAGGEYKVSNFLLAGGVSFVSNSQKTESNPGGAGAGTTKVTATTTGFPVFNLGTEWWFVDWLAGRVGYYRAFASTDNKTEPPAPGFTTETSAFAGNSTVAIGSFNDDNLVTLGLGLRFGNFALDATVSENALRRGLGLLGAADNINTFGYLTASYNFE
jgi:hypothetical protein